MPDERFRAAPIQAPRPERQRAKKGRLACELAAGEVGVVHARQTRPNPLALREWSPRHRNR